MSGIPLDVSELPGRLLTLAFQGKQAGAVGGTTVHSGTAVPRSDTDGILDTTQDQSPLTEGKLARWKGVGVLALEEVSMLACQLLGCIQKACVAVIPSGAGMPYAGMMCVTFGDLNQLSPVSKKSVTYGATDSGKLNKLTHTERVGHANFWAANASVVLDETNNRFSPAYAPIMDRLLRGECNYADLNAINSRVLNTVFTLPDGREDKLSMKHCWMAQTITFRDKVTQALTMPTTRALCEARGTVLYVTRATTVHTGSRFPRQKMKAHDPLKSWPTGLRDGVADLETSKTANLAQNVCLGIGGEPCLSEALKRAAALGEADVDLSQGMPYLSESSKRAAAMEEADVEMCQGDPFLSLTSARAAALGEGDLDISQWMPFLSEASKRAAPMEGADVEMFEGGAISQ